MNGKIRILHAITRLDKGGSSENTLLSAIGLAKRGYKVDVLFGRTEDANLRLLREAEACGVDFIEEENLLRDIHPVKDFFAFLNILKFLRDKKYDIVHAHSSKAGLICRLAAKMSSGSKVIYTPHGHVFYGYFGKGLSRAIIFTESVLARMTDRMIGLTPAECDEWLSFGIGRKEQYAAVPSGIDFRVIDAEILSGRDLRLELGIPKDAFVAGSVGRFVGVKGFEYLIEAAVGLLGQRKDIYFVLAGDGPRRESYKAILEVAGCGGRFHIIGWQDNTASAINAMDVFVLPSLNEGMGRVLIEAMYLRKPIVAAKVGGVPSVVPGDTGILVEPASSKAINDAILSIIADRRRMGEMGERGHEMVVSGYSAEVMVDKLDRLYRELLVMGHES